MTPVVAVQAVQAFSSQETIQLASADTRYGYRHAKMLGLQKYISEQYRIPSEKASLIIGEAFNHGIKHDIEPELILAIIAVESTFRERAVSRMGARGLMQVMPRYHPKKVRKIGGIHALFDPRKNIATGSKILVSYLGDSRGNLRRALLRYNGSLGNPKSRYADKVLRVYGNMKKASARTS